MSTCCTSFRHACTQTYKYVSCKPIIISSKPNIKDICDRQIMMANILQLVKKLAKKKKNIFVAHTWRGLSLKIFTAFKQHRANNNRGVWFKTFTISPSAEQYKVYVWYYASNTFEYILNLHWMLHIYTVLMILTMCTNNHVFDSLLSTYSNIPSSWESSITLNASV